MHAGHARGAAFGDSLARLLEFTGHRVTREFYVNDRGVQMQLFGESLAARRDGKEPPEGGYHGRYVTEWASHMPADADPVQWGRDWALADQRRVLERMNVTFDSWFSEKEMVDTGAIERTLADLRERGVVYEADGALWLRSTDYGDDKDGPIKSDGEHTYLRPTSPTTAISSPAARPAHQRKRRPPRLRAADERRSAGPATTPPTSRRYHPAGAAEKEPREVKISGPATPSRSRSCRRGRHRGAPDVPAPVRRFHPDRRHLIVAQSNENPAFYA